MKVHTSLRIAMTVAALAAATWAPALASVTLHVKPNGADSNPGTRSRPFATLERARDAVRSLQRNARLDSGPVTVAVHPGIYELPKPMEITSGDSGTAGVPIVWRSSKPGAARLVGGRFVRGWQPVTDPQVIERLDPAAGREIFQLSR